MEARSVKPGWKSSELWLSVAALVLVNLSAVLVESEITKVAALVGNALIAAGYSFSRAKVKSNDG